MIVVDLGTICRFRRVRSSEMLPAAIHQATNALSDCYRPQLVTANLLGDERLLPVHGRHRDGLDIVGIHDVGDDVQRLHK